MMGKGAGSTISLDTGAWCIVASKVGWTYVNSSTLLIQFVVSFAVLNEAGVVLDRCWVSSVQSRCLLLCQLSLICLLFAANLKVLRQSWREFATTMTLATLSVRT